MPKVNKKSFPISPNKMELIVAVMNNDIKKTEALLKEGANPNQIVCSSKGSSFLHLATLAGYVEIVTLLLKHGADVNKTNEIGFTALHYAANKDYLAITQLLLKSGASKFIKDNEDKTPGQWIKNKDSKLISLLPKQNFFHDLPRMFEGKVNSGENPLNCKPFQR